MYLSQAWYFLQLVLWVFLGFCFHIVQLGLIQVGWHFVQLGLVLGGVWGFWLGCHKVQLVWVAVLVKMVVLARG